MFDLWLMIGIGDFRVIWAQPSAWNLIPSSEQIDLNFLLSLREEFLSIHHFNCRHVKRKVQKATKSRNGTSDHINKIAFDLFLRRVKNFTAHVANAREAREQPLGDSHVPMIHENEWNFFVAILLAGQVVVSFVIQLHSEPTRADYLLSMTRRRIRERLIFAGEV